ncbi:IRE protein kinase [Kwoniella mangroviensis CBS 8886]|nr:IRE protein kinase [Kwoniella mangroviensis CBS 8886]
MISTALVTSHLLALLLPLILLSPINTHAAPEPAALVALPQHTTTTANHKKYAPPQPELDHDVLPFVIISTIDGGLHAVERDTGRIKWSIKDGVEPLVGGGIRGKGNDEEYIVEPLSGSLYVFEDENGEGMTSSTETKEGQTPKIRKLPLSVEQLIELSPFTFPHSPSRIFTGSKHTSLLTLDLRTGQQLDCFNSFGTNQSHCVCENEELLDDLEGKSRSNRDLLFVGRTDYKLTIHSPPIASSYGGLSPSTSTSTIYQNAAEAKRNAGAQEITYSTYTPNSYDRPLADYWVKNGLAEQGWGDEGGEKRTRVELAYDGDAVGVENGNGVKWVTRLNSIGIAVYDVLLPLDSPSANPILVPQPPPHLPTLFPPTSRPYQHFIDIAKKPQSTYIGSIPLQLALPPSSENVSEPLSDDKRKPLLYALSSSAYPLINFAPPPRPGSLTNGSFLLTEDLPEKDQLLPYLIDPPTEDKALVLAQQSTLPMSNIREREIPRRGWFWWILSTIGTLLIICGIALTQFARSPRVKQSSSPADEKTPLLITPSSEESTSEARTGSAKVEEKSLPGDIASPPTLAPPVESEEVATPKKKSTRRRVRGKKKRRDSSAAILEEGGEDDEEDKEGSGSGVSPKKDDEKPLPDLPREMSSTDLLDQEDKERLSISDTIIGFGSHGTVVLKGTWGGRPVAVKRLLSDFTRLASQEVKLLQASDDHPNVIRYYCQEKRDNFLYIALDLCQASLADLIETPDKHLELASSLDRKKALTQITAGLKHLHGMKIIHRDIKPQNVLVSRAKDGALRMLVSDFGLARRLDQGQSSFAPTANNLAGSLGWRAPECIRGQVKLNEGVTFDPNSTFSSSSSSTHSMLDELDEPRDKDKDKNNRLTKAVDLFALGCLYFWVLMSGQHPYGETYNRESNIVKGDMVNISDLDVLGEEGEEAKELISRLLSMEPGSRPDTSECLVHPFFWTPGKRLSFLCDASDRFEIMENDPPEATLVMLETNGSEVVGKDWYSKLDKTFTSTLGKYRKYKGASVRDLLRALRNKKHHYQDLEPSVKRHMGSLPNGFLHYFTSRYPKLFLHVHGVVKESMLRHESMFEGYFQEGNQ